MKYTDFLKKKEAQNTKNNEPEREYSPATQSDLEYFEKLNVTTDSIFDLGSHDVLIVLEDGRNLTDWGDVKNKSDVQYVSEDLSGEMSLKRKYKDLTNLRLVVAQNASSEIKSTYSMFSGCRRLVDVVGFETWDTVSLESLENMFGGCSSMVSCDGLRYLDVSEVRNMTGLFVDCDSLSNLDFLKGWDVSKVTKMWSMFGDCKSLGDISGLKDWDVSNVTDMRSMFTGCGALKDLTGLESWDVSNVSNFHSMFWGCQSLENISALGRWDTSGVSDMGRMFVNCEAMSDISPLGSWDVSNVDDMVYMFVNCKSLKDLAALEMWDVSKVKIMRCMFGECSSLETLDGLESWNQASVTTVERMFEGCTSLSDVSSLRSWNIPNDVTSGGIFNGCTNVEENPLKKEIADRHRPLNYVDLNFKFLDVDGSWCRVCLGDIYSRASHITDVPYHCLTSIINAIKNDEEFHVNFDAEGWTFEVRADNEQCYFNFRGGERHLFDTMNKYDLAIVIYRNIRFDFQSWQRWSDRDLNPLLNDLARMISEWR